jgi:hypothetical protein
MDKLRREYDRFGPWVSEITKEVEVPQQFDKFSEIILNADLSFKIPVVAERRDLKPGMLLYHTVILVTGNTLNILNLEDGAPVSRKIDLQKLQYFQSTKAILYAELTLVAADQSLVIAFNAVKPEQIERLERHIRDYYFTPEVTINLEKIVEPIHEKSFLYEALLSEEAKKERLKVIAYQPSIELHGEYLPILKQLLVVSEEYSLEDTLFLTNGSELIVISRIKDLKEAQQSNYGYRHTYISLDKIRTILLEPEAKVQGVLNLSIVMKSTRVIFKVESGFPIDTFESALNIQ